MQATEVHGIRVELPHHHPDACSNHDERERVRALGIVAASRTTYDWGGNIIIDAKSEDLNALANWLNECAVVFAAASDLINRRAAAVV